MVTGSGEKRFHDQISWLMFLFSIFVIWVHSYNVDLFSGGAQDGLEKSVHIRTFFQKDSFEKRAPHSRYFSDELGALLIY